MPGCGPMRFRSRRLNTRVERTTCWHGCDRILPSRIKSAPSPSPTRALVCASCADKHPRSYQPYPRRCQRRLNSSDPAAHDGHRLELGSCGRWEHDGLPAASALIRGRAEETSRSRALSFAPSPAGHGENRGQSPFRCAGPRRWRRFEKGEHPPYHAMGRRRCITFLPTRRSAPFLLIGAIRLLFREPDGWRLLLRLQCTFETILPATTMPARRRTVARRNQKFQPDGACRFIQTFSARCPARSRRRWARAATPASGGARPRPPPPRPSAN